jgi:hypothetical protein
VVGRLLHQPSHKMCIGMKDNFDSFRYWNFGIIQVAEISVQSFSMCLSWRLSTATRTWRLPMSHGCLEVDASGCLVIDE